MTGAFTNSDSWFSPCHLFPRPNPAEGVHGLGEEEAGVTPAATECRCLGGLQAQVEADVGVGSQRNRRHDEATVGLGNEELLHEKLVP